MKELLAILNHLDKPGALPATLATLVKVEGSSYRRAGARLLLTAAGTRIGSISGGCLEDDVIERARSVLVSGIPQTVVYDTTDENDLVWGVGLGCNGVVHVLLERLAIRPAWAEVVARNARNREATALTTVYESDQVAHLGTRLADSRATVPGSDTGLFHEIIEPPTRLVIFGAGDDAQPLSSFAKELGWHVTVVDPRPTYATRERFPAADNVLVAQPTNAVEAADVGAHSLAIVMTHHYVHDVPLLRALLPRQLPYLGLLGPRKRAEKILADLAAGGLVVSDAMRSQLHAPVGLDLGGDTPDFVALSMLAEMKATLEGRDARPLRERKRPIHG